MVIEIIKLKNKMKINLNDLITRPLGEKFYKKVSKLIDNASENEVVLLDFEGINVADPSFLDEFIVKIIKGSRDGKKAYYVKLKNFTESTSLNLKSVIESYNSYNDSRMAVATESVVDNSTYCIGDIDDIEKSILGFLKINKTGTIEEIAAYIDKDEEETQDRLINLYNLRIIRKDEFEEKRFYGV